MTGEVRDAHYPTVHLAALTDRNARPNLLVGAHSLWYEVKVLLHQALTDLDIAVAAVPEPVRKAISAELEAEAHALKDELAEYREGVESSPPEGPRIWDFGAPFVALDDESLSGLGQEERDNLNDLERGLAQSDLDRAVADLRLLLDAFLRCANSEVRLLLDGFEISDDPYDEVGDRYFLNFQAPMPDGKWNRTDWNVEICRWVPDGPQSEGMSSSNGESILDCARAEPPALAEIVELLNRSNGESDVLAAWAQTSAGEALAGTAFVVTKRYDG
ncbi:hypothetical protein [Kibdelosporangium aridum]|uniref:hypothetical protein n=1 Tax=Kibdelosporangium aridum TaxID=2030 RepID=UPI0035EEA8F5